MVSYPVVLRSGEDGYIVAECPVLPGCISQGRTRAEALANIREAIELCLEDDGQEAPAAPFYVELEHVAIGSPRHEY